MPAGVRPLSTMGPTFAAMGDAAKRANVEAIERSTKKLGAFVNAEGARFHIKGRRGNKVPLMAKTDVRGFNGRDGVVFTGAVRGIPEGFWAIVEYGSGRHLITRRTDKGRTKKVTSKMLTSLAEGTTFAKGRPLFTPYGPRQWVDHPGHRPLGSPWATAMRVGAPVIANEMQYQQTRAMTKAFVASL